MPFQSVAQRSFLFAKHPDIAKRWAREYGTAIQQKKVKKQAALTAICRVCLPPTSLGDILACPKLAAAGLTPPLRVAPSWQQSVPVTFGAKPQLPKPGAPIKPLGAPGAPSSSVTNPINAYGGLLRPNIGAAFGIQSRG